MTDVSTPAAPAPAAAPAAEASLPSGWGRLTYFLLFHVLPGAFFALVAVNRLLGFAAYVTQPPPLTTPEATATFLMTALHRLLVIVFIGMIAVLFAIRRPARRRTTNPVAIAVAFVGTFIVTGVASAPYTIHDGWVVFVADILLIAGNVGSIVALSQLGRNLSITPGARGLVTTGLYGRVRHPLYAAEIVASFGSLLPALSPVTVVLFGAFVWLQVRRTHYEEALLTEMFPEYEAYRQRVPRLLPRLG